jgi:hypothetical protein
VAVAIGIVIVAVLYWIVRMFREPASEVAKEIKPAE